MNQYRISKLARGADRKWVIYMRAQRKIRTVMAQKFVPLFMLPAFALLPGAFVGRNGFAPVVTEFAGRVEFVLLVGRGKLPLLLKVVSPGKLPVGVVVSVGIEGLGEFGELVVAGGTGSGEFGGVVVVGVTGSGEFGGPVGPDGCLMLVVFPG